MARRRLTSPLSLEPWPSFVDALSAALLVLVFIITLLSIRSGRVLEGIKEEAAASEAEAAITEAIAKAVETEGVTVVRDEGRLRILLPDALLFESGQAEIKGEGVSALLALAPRLKEVPGEVEVQGHTDDRPITGALAERFATNWELSTARATAVVRLLEDVGGIDPARLSGVGFGEHRPIADNASPQGPSHNRRIEIVVEPRVEALKGFDGVGR